MEPKKKKRGVNAGTDIMVPRVMHKARHVTASNELKGTLLKR